MSSIYYSETKRFFQFLPITFSEGFMKVDYEEVNELYQHFSHKIPLNLNKLNKYKEIFPYLENNNFFGNRPF